VVLFRSSNGYFAIRVDAGHGILDECDIRTLQDLADRDDGLLSASTSSRRVKCRVEQEMITVIDERDLETFIITKLQGEFQAREAATDDYEPYIFLFHSNYAYANRLEKAT
jgi:hypothetical protein